MYEVGDNHGSGKRIGAESQPIGWTHGKIKEEKERMRKKKRKKEADKEIEVNSHMLFVIA